MQDMKMCSTVNARKGNTNFRNNSDEQIKKLLSLIKRTGCELVQLNGQRKFGPPKTWSGPPPPKGCEVFVGKLPREILEDELVPLFERVGTIYEMRLMMDFSGSNRGFGFVQYTNPLDATEAIQELNNYEIRPGWTIGVVKSVDNRRLFVGGLPKTKNKDEITIELTKLVEGVVDVILYSCVMDKTKSRGFAFVEFENHRAAAMARRQFLRSRYQLWGQDIAVDWAQPEPEVDVETMSKVMVLYVRNLIVSTTENAIKTAFESISGHSTIERVKKLKDFAFVHFTSREAAQQIIDCWNKQEFEGSVIEVMWAKPIDKMQYQMQKYLNNSGTLNLNTRYDAMRAVANQQPYWSTFDSQSSHHPLHRLPGRGPGSHLSHSYNEPQKLYEHAEKALLDMCQKYHWGEPTYHNAVVPTLEPYKQSYYICRIQLPHYIGNQTHFQGTKYSYSPEEARAAAAEQVLQICTSQQNFEQQSMLHGRPLQHTTLPAVAFTPTTGYLIPGKVPGYETAQYYETQYPVQI